MIEGKNEQAYTLSEETLRQALCQKLEEGRSLPIQFFSIFTFYMIINGVLLKGWTDADNNTTRKILIAALGLLLAILSLFISRFPYIVRKGILDDIQRLNSLLGSPLESEQLTLSKYIVFSTQLFIGAIGVMWIVLLLGVVTGQRF